MVQLELFSHPGPGVRYRAGLCSTAALGLLLLWALTYLPPLLVAYRSQGELRDRGTAWAQPTSGAKAWHPPSPGLQALLPPVYPLWRRPLPACWDPGSCGAGAQ